MAEKPTLKVACVQISSGDDIATNTARAEHFIREAAAGGAQLICLPENVFLMQDAKQPRSPIADEAHPAIAHMRELASELGCWLLVGSVQVAAPHGDKAFNRSLLINPQGEVASQYDKIHLFDVQLPGGESYKESDRITPGNKAVMAETPWGKMGLSVCYDVRFPQHYREMAQKGAEILTVPAAFTHTTGQTDWEPLLRARAIENLAFVVAPAQCGEHPGGRRTWGHSLVIDPYGKVLADGGEKEGVVFADLDLSLPAKRRSEVPSLEASASAHASAARM